MLPNSTITANLVGQKLGQYHLISGLGGNEFFTVYKAYYRGAYDYVAVKVLHSSLLGSPGFIDRFQNLPGAFADIDHHSICKLYECGIQDDMFYLVTEFIDGVSLAREIESRQRKNQSFSLTEITFIVQAIGQSIDYANGLNLFHGHIKPANILFTQEGVPVLTDFELSSLIDPAEFQSVSTTSFTDIQRDIKALGWVLYQLAGGKTPDPSPANGTLRIFDEAAAYYSAHMLELLKAIIHKAIEPTPDNHFQRAMEMVEALQTLIHLDEPVTHISCTAQTSSVKQITVATDTPRKFKAMPGMCPYQGLFAFHEENAQLFFGREIFIDQLVNMVQQKPIIMVTGPSGSGKSSVVYAGLVPYLRQSGGWKIVALRPGLEPIQALAATLSPLLVTDMTETERSQKNYQLAEEMLCQHISLFELVTQILQDNHAGQQMLLVIDQFEELYTLCSDENIRRHFLDMIVDATSAPVFQRKFYVVLTLRVDFLGQVLSHRAFADRLYQADIKLGPMNRSELKRAIENPATQQGVTFEDGLIERILNDVGNEPGTLPLLQFALTQLWSAQHESQLTHQAYEEINGVTGALARYADHIYEALDTFSQAQARRILMRLVRPGESTEDTRRLAYRSELDEVDWQLAQQLVDARLMVSGSTPDGQETVEVVHEALIGKWQKLQDWIIEDRAFHTWQDRLWTAMRQWEASDRDDGALLRGVLLVEAESWFSERQINLSQLEQNYIQASIALRKQHESQELNAQQNRERSRRFIIISLTMGLAVALFLALFSLSQWQHARDQQLIALSNQLAAQALSHTESQEYDLAQLLSLESYRLVDSLESRSALMVSLLRSPYRNILRHYKYPVMATALSSDSRLLVTLEINGTIELTDAKTGQTISQIMYENLGKTNTIALSPNNQMVASGDSTGRIILWDVSNPNEPKIMRNIEQPAGVGKVVFSPDSETLAGGGVDGRIFLWNVDTGQLKGDPLSKHTGDVRSLAFSPNGHWLASGSINDAWATMDEIVMLWDLSEPAPQRYQLVGLTNDVYDVVFSSDGRLVAASSTNGAIMLWNAETQHPLNEPFYHSSNEQSASVALPEIKIALSPDQQTLASGGVDGEIILWDLDTGKPQREPLPTHAGSINDLAFSQDGHTLVSANNDGAVILWAIDLQLGESLPRLDQRIWSLAFNPVAIDQPQLISGGEDGTIIFWDITSGQSVGQQIMGHSEHVNSVAVSPIGRILASGSDDQTVRLWDISTGDLLTAPLLGHTDNVLNVAFNPNGQILASTSRDDTIILWDMSTFQPIGEPLTGHTDDVLEAAFSFDGKILASASWDGSIILWDVGTQKAIGKPLTEHEGAVVSVAASPIEPILASAGRDGKIILWDISTGQSVKTLFQESPGTVWRVTFSPDGKTLASAGCAQLTARGNCEHGEIRLWDVATGRQMGQSFVGHQDVAWAITFSPDGKKLASGGRDGAIIVWDLDLDSWIKQACDIANRNFTEAEWQQYLGDEAYHETCNLNDEITH